MQTGKPPMAFPEPRHLLPRSRGRRAQQPKKNITINQGNCNLTKYNTGKRPEGSTSKQEFAQTRSNPARRSASVRVLDAIKRLALLAGEVEGDLAGRSDAPSLCHEEPSSSTTSCSD